MYVSGPRSMNLSRQDFLAQAYVVVLMIVTAISLFSATPRPLDDHFLYQQFVESLARGDLDLTIPGFHGSDLFAVPLYWMTHSPLAQITALMIVACFIPLVAFLAGRSIFRSIPAGVLLASILTMMPFISFVALRGWTGPGYFLLMLLTLWFGSRGSLWTGVVFGLAILTKPFAIGLLPLLLVIAQKSASLCLRYRRLIIAPILVLLYLAMQYIQAGRIFVGTHSEVSSIGIWQGPQRIFLNLAHALQILFSVHNYYYPDPGLTGPGNMMHTTPILIFLGLWGVFSPKEFFDEGHWTSEIGHRSADSPKSEVRTPKSVPLALLSGAVLIFFMNALLDHMDHFYMEAGVLLLILAAIPVLMKYPLWVPIVLATLHFQWFYFYLQFQEIFHLTPVFFLVPATVDIFFLIWCLVSLSTIRQMLHHTIFSSPS